MGQTLPNDIYLPAEGERNCYDGLEGNWRSLDSLISTVAGKASATHTHGNITNDGKVGTTANLPLITGTGGAVQAGAFGNQANTFCEGNDSRLSDARTPVAHTHTKSDVTDLFNSANTWSALNAYSNGQIRIKSQSQEIGVIPSSSVIQYLEFADKNDAQHGIVGLWDYSNGASEIQMYITDKFKNGAKDPTGTTDTTILSFGFKTDGSKFLTFSGQVDNSVIPKSNNTYDLGSSSYQWSNLYANKVNTQSVNGVNPGALSLPSRHYVEIGTDGWDLTGTTYNRVYINNANPTFPGILFIRINSTTATDILVKLFTTSGQEISYVGSKMEAGSNNMIVTVPCPPSTNIYVSIKTSSTIYTCRYYTLLGDPEFDSRSGS